MGPALSSLRALATGRPHRGGLRPVDTAAASADAADTSSPLWLVVGLGNPGPRYERTRHNVGWRVVDELAARAGTRLDRAQCNAAVGRGMLADTRVLLVKPLTFMNVSGEAVGGLAKFHRVPPSRVIAVHDDLDTAPARVRLRGGGGHGGHNGVRSLIQHFGGDKAFARVRIGEEIILFLGLWVDGRGETPTPTHTPLNLFSHRHHHHNHPFHSPGIGRPPEHMPVAAYVLQDFPASEAAAIESAVQEGADAVCAVLGLGLEKALSGVRLPAGGRAA